MSDTATDLIPELEGYVPRQIVFDIAGSLERAGCSRFVISDQAEKHHWKHGDRHLLADFCSHTNRPVMAHCAWPSKP